jgi:hypothetical protein
MYLDRVCRRRWYLNWDESVFGWCLDGVSEKIVGCRERSQPMSENHDWRRLAYTLQVDFRAQLPKIDSRSTYGPPNAAWHDLHLVWLVLLSYIVTRSACSEYQL